MVALITFGSGLLFGLGLIVSGMVDPAKVTGFLDLAGNWDPSLAFVMGGAIAVAACGFALASRRKQTWFGHPLVLSPKRPVDARLVCGAAIFGLGWGVAGICPGPGLVLAAAGWAKGGVFVLAMLAGMAVFEVAARLHRRKDGE